MAGVFSSRIAVTINGTRIPEITNFSATAVRDFSVPVAAMSDDLNIQGYTGNQRLYEISITVPNRYIPLVSLNFQNFPLNEGITIVAVRGQQTSRVEFDGYTEVFSECRLKTQGEVFPGVGVPGETTIVFYGNCPETAN